MPESDEKLEALIALINKYFSLQQVIKWAKDQFNHTPPVNQVGQEYKDEGVREIITALHDEGRLNWPELSEHLFELAKPILESIEAFEEEWKPDC